MGFFACTGLGWKLDISEYRISFCMKKDYQLLILASVKFCNPLGFNGNIKKKNLCYITARFNKVIFFENQRTGNLIPNNYYLLYPNRL